MSMNQPRPGIKRIDFLAICGLAEAQLLFKSVTHDSSGLGHHTSNVYDIDKAKQSAPARPLSDLAHLW
jgi:hypothetical protein